MILEKDMETAIATNPKRYLGEAGLELIERQYRIGGYIFDLLFKDRHGAKLIVEIQKGTLDREHTYKIMDYYDGFREQHPNEFIELMVIANKIPDERKKRLRAWGVEFREVPIEEFSMDNTADKLTPSQLAITLPFEDEVRVDGVQADDSARQSYLLFKDQKNRFVEGLLRVDKDVKVRGNWTELSPQNVSKYKNWFIGFVPNSWGVFKQGWFGVHFGFIWHRDPKTGIGYVRFPVGVEKPLNPNFHDAFKDDVVAALIQRKINLPDCAIWPNVGFRKKKLIEPTPIVLDTHSWEMVLNRYSALNDFVEVVADVMKKYYKRGCFTARLDFYV